jgi:hypothetical protein
MSHPALQYAESTLGVHEVYQEGRDALERLELALNTLDEAQDKRRALDEQIAAREMDLLIEERGKHPDHSEAAFTRHLKEVHYKDDLLKALRGERATAAGVVSGSELDVDFYRMRVKFTSARMEELGGYFNYLAAVKNAEAQMPLSPVQGLAQE